MMTHQWRNVCWKNAIIKGLADIHAVYVDDHLMHEYCFLGGMLFTE